MRRKYTSTKKTHFVEGWIEFKEKKVARSVAEMLNAQPIGGKKGSRWRDDIWTMKYLPKFKWNMLTEQIGASFVLVVIRNRAYALSTIAHEAAVHAARLRVELSQSKREQQEYMKNVELAHVLEKRAERKRKAGQDDPVPAASPKKHRLDGPPKEKKVKGPSNSSAGGEDKALSSVLSSIF